MEDFGQYFWGGIILLGIIGWIIDLVVKTNKDEKKTTIDDNTIKLDIEPFQLYGEEFGTFQKILNFGAAKSEVMTYFSYNDGIVTIKNRKGESFRCALGGLTVVFDKMQGVTFFKISGRYGKMRLIQTTNFTDKEWEKIFYVLCNASKTSGTYIFGNVYKGLKYANTAMKILNHL